MGHVHKILFEPRIYEEIEVIDGMVYKSVKKQYWLASGSFLKDAAYAEMKSYPMNVIGAPVVRFFATSNKLDMHTLEYRSQDFTDYAPDMTELEYQQVSRPPCPRCGQRDHQSRGSQWYCKSCGRFFKK